VRRTQAHAGDRTRGRHRATGRRLPALLIAAVLAMAGCGGSSKDEPSTSATVTPNSVASTAPTVAQSSSSSSMIATADLICRRLNAALDAENTTVRSLGAITGAAARRAAVEEAALSALATLEPPAALARDWQQIITYRRALAGNLVKLSGEARRKEFSAFRALSASTAIAEHELLTTGKRAGFKYCTRVG
jgi:hypothetical protein